LDPPALDSRRVASRRLLHHLCRAINALGFARRQLGANQLNSDTRSVPNFQNSVIWVNIQQFDHLCGYLSIRPRHDDAA
jgi:hypothetical protein